MSSRSPRTKRRQTYERTNHDSAPRSKYQPHQGKRELERAAKRAKRAEDQQPPGDGVHR